MADLQFEELRAKFIKVFAAVPIPLRSEIIAVVDDAPVNWSTAYLEIEQGTPKARKIIKLLKEIGLL